MSTARNLFQNNCAQCHGSDGGGATGFPNLTRARLAVGRRRRTPSMQTITGGRIGVDAAVGRRCSAREGVRRGRGLRADSLSGQHGATRRCAAAGKALFETICVGLPRHGRQGQPAARRAEPDGRRSGCTAATTRRCSRPSSNGRNGQMPAFGERLGAAARAAAGGLRASSLAGDAVHELEPMFGARRPTSTRASCGGRASDRTWPSCSGPRSSRPAWPRWSASRSSIRC